MCYHGITGRVEAAKNLNSCSGLLHSSIVSTHTSVEYISLGK
jgi:hypothetical protein